MVRGADPTNYENPRFTEELRHLLFGLRRGRRYRALFAVRGQEVVILDIRVHGERPPDPSDIE